ncbi:hypothetical protein B0H10DRAFT_1944004 [Mycena sp. CBHHK59/15]|nr:hypothetical protein B0H10DRAFT_1944004 [Mycena sp. CBHHK59/15]
MCWRRKRQVGGAKRTNKALRLGVDSESLYSRAGLPPQVLTPPTPPTPPTRSSIRCLVHLGGVKRLSGLMYEETRCSLKMHLENVLRDSHLHTQLAKPSAPHRRLLLLTLMLTPCSTTLTALAVVRLNARKRVSPVTASVYATHAFLHSTHGVVVGGQFE